MNQQVNLYTAELRPQRQKLSARSALALAVLVLLAVAGLTGWEHWRNQQLDTRIAAVERQNQSLEKAIATMASQVEARKPDQELEAALERVTETIVRRQRLLERVEGLTAGGDAGFSGRLAALARQIPDDLWLTYVHLRADPAAMRIEGQTRSAERVPGYLASLGQEPAFIGETFSDFLLSRPEDGAGRNWVEFRVATKQSGEAGE